jgi:hypothetical protein
MLQLQSRDLGSPGDNWVLVFVILWSNYDRHALLRRHVGAGCVAVEDSVSIVGSPFLGSPWSAEHIHKTVVLQLVRKEKHRTE